VRKLCFDVAQYGNRFELPFSEAVPDMLDHGVRQAALALEVMTDENIRDRLPAWFDLKLFAQTALVADVGLTFVPAEEVEYVHQFGPKRAVEYTAHPYGYGMAQKIGTPDTTRQTIAGFIARHHMIQAKNAYGLDWQDIEHTLVDPHKVDLMVAMQKPFDYADDCFDRTENARVSYEAAVTQPLDRFIKSTSLLRHNNADFAAAIEQTGFDPTLPAQVAEETKARLLGESAISNVYRDLQRTLTAA